ncbi:MAG: hypothetical protein FWF97_01655 [Alphaproteobacteria bacterium]|nr:hypothetical protein [Alphaproteobacteria bacterium]
MRKVLLAITAVALAACSNTVKLKSGADELVQLKAEPTACTFLYQLESDVSMYSEDDAVRFVKNQIAARGNGNAFWIKSKDTRQNEWRMFAPERSFVMTTLVYDCQGL